VRSYSIVYPEGYREVKNGAGVPEEGTRLSVGIVSYVSRRDKREPTVYLDPATPKPQRVVMFVVGDDEQALSLGETAQLGDYLRRMSEGSLGPSTTAAIGIEGVLDEATGQRPTGEVDGMDFFDSEKAAMQTAIEVWLMEVGVDGFPKRVLHLLNALREDAQKSAPDDPASAS
jgi:hypothetical protein